MRRVISAILSIVILCSLFTLGGCSKKSNTSFNSVKKALKKCGYTEIKDGENCTDYKRFSVSEVKASSEGNPDISFIVAYRGEERILEARYYSSDLNYAEAEFLGLYNYIDKDIVTGNIVRSLEENSGSVAFELVSEDMNASPIGKYGVIYYENNMLLIVSCEALEKPKQDVDALLKELGIESFNDMVKGYINGHVN